MTAISLAQAQAKLALWMEADERVAAGQSFTIAGRSLSRVDAAEIRENISFWEAKVQKIEASASGRRRTRYVVNE